MPSRSITSKKVLLKNKKKRSGSSKEWLLRQLNDVYVKKAQQEGYRSRAAFKLLEIQQKYHLLKPGLAVVDLGSAPGGWTQVAVAAVKASAKNPVIAIDLLPMEPLLGAQLVQGNFSEVEPLLRQLYPAGVDVVLSDMAPPSCGVPQVDHLRLTALALEVWGFVLSNLKEGGSFILKVFRGGAERELLTIIKKHFPKVRHYKPPSSRKESQEIYLIAQDYHK